MMPRLSPITVWALIAGMAALTAFIANRALKCTAELNLPVNSPDRRPGWPDMRIDLNVATTAELCVLPGLGPMLAQRIVEDRNSHGRFASVDDLDRVTGIGPAIVERLREYAVVDSKTQSDAAGRIEDE
jgi:competence protein ComEA